MQYFNQVLILVLSSSLPKESAMEGMNTAQIKELNRELVRRALKERDAATKDEISRETGLSQGTCRTILNELCDSGEAKEISLADSTGGRPSRRFVYNPDHAHTGLLYPRLEGDEKTLYSTVLNMSGETSYERFDNYDEIDLEVIDREIGRMIEAVPLPQGDRHGNTGGSTERRVGRKRL